jgi:hypothetical protein
LNPLVVMHWHFWSILNLSLCVINSMCSNANKINIEAQGNAIYFA